MNFLQAKKLFEKGLEKLVAKDYESSIEFFESSLKIAKDRPSTLKNLVIAYIGINNLKKAEYYLKSLINLTLIKILKVGILDHQNGRYTLLNKFFLLLTLIPHIRHH